MHGQPGGGIFHPTTNTTRTFTGSAELIVYDLVGKIVSEKELSLKPGSNTFPLDLSAAGEGLYFATLHFGDHVSTQKILITK